MIELSGVTVEFDSGVERVLALADVSVAVTPGEFIVLQGTSGSGKSTLINAIAGLVRVDRGIIKVDDVRVDQSSERQLAAMRLNHVGIVFQDNNLVPELTASENVEFPLRARGEGRKVAREEAQKALSRVEMAHLTGRRPSQLSGGQKQRVGIARAIAGSKQYLLADEPTGALDSATSLGIFKLMRQLADANYGVLVASHDPRIAQWADRTIEMIDGQIHPLHVDAEAILSARE